MIGNDLIDLQLAAIESNWKRKGYLDKIYTIAEQEIILSDANPELLVWILWSMKEASYKANNRITAVKEYAPTKINCKITEIENNVYYGTACYNNLEYQIKTSVFTEYIHTIALYKSNAFSTVSEIIIENFSIDYTNDLKNCNFLNSTNLIVKNELGIPNLFDNVSKEIKPISISHHGKFLGVIMFKD
ncbi:4'-phosphopantetheinyl transferase superfamily protein [Flavobacterium sp.]|jgi:phosphopantetheinyl transferase (holo-ACP synthase)|uniref:4'-phosphopantetheinyl transferase superfamily protein n=1 Tax=Flavobacterium sp. TaxID=239 RepID=UPI0037C13FA8